MVINILCAVLVFSVIVLFHELGHFLMAKRAGIGVVEFSLGMGPRILSFVRGGTRYSWKILPLGGSCMMLGEDMDDVPEEEIPDGVTGIPFGQAPAFARFLVIFGGPLFNFLMAFLCAFVMILMSGYDRPVIQSVMEGYPAEEAGLQAGDTVTDINGHAIRIYRDMTAYTQTHTGAELEVTVLRGGEKRTVTLTPAYSAADGRYLIGIRGGAYEKANVLTAAKYRVYELRYWVYITYESLFMLVRRQVSPDELSGPVRVVSMIGTTVQETRQYGIGTVIVNLLNMTVLLSVNLAVMNLLPLPALDGGRLLFIIVEMIRGRRVDPELEAKVHIAGFGLLMALMVFVFYNDIRMLLK